MSDRVYCLTRVYGSDYERVVCVDTRPRAPSRQGGTAKLQLVRCVIQGWVAHSVSKSRGTEKVPGFEL